MSSTVDLALTGAITGGDSTATVSENVVATGVPPSSADRVTDAAPVSPGTGVIVTAKVRLFAVVPLTDIVTPAFGSKVVFDELVASASALPAVSTSVTVTVVCAAIPGATVADTGVRETTGGLKPASR